MILVGRHRAFNESLLRISLTARDVRVPKPRVEVVQQRARCEDTKADPGDVGPEATRGSSVCRTKARNATVGFSCRLGFFPADLTVRQGPRSFKFLRRR